MTFRAKTSKHTAGPAAVPGASIKVFGAAEQEHLRMLQRGIEHQRAGDLRQAENCYQRVLHDRPDHPEASNLLGTLAILAEKYATAARLIEPAVKAAPKNAMYRNNLGNALLLGGHPEKALRHLRKATALESRMIEAWINLARSYRKLEKGDSALKAYERALALNPQSTRVRTGIGDTLVDLGRMGEATELFRGVLSVEPDNIAAIAGLASARTFTTEDNDLERFEAALTNASLKGGARAAIHSAAGKICDDLKRHDDAFDHYLQAKAVSGSEFRLTDYRRFVDKSVELFAPLFYFARKGFGDTSERPVFVVGMPRSGTTLTEQILASHPKIAGAGELTEMEKIVRQVTNRAKIDSDAYFKRIGALDGKDAKTLAKPYLSAIHRHSPSAARVIDKMPHNFQSLGLIALLFPNARVVHCMRSPMDNCVSCFTHHFNKAHGYTQTLEMLGLYYREYRRLMAHFTNVLPLRIFELPYEDMIADQEGMSRKLIDFLDLEWDDACLRFHETERTVRTLSRWQVRQPIYTSSVERWRHYDRHLGPLKEALGDLFVEG